MPVNCLTNTALLPGVCYKKELTVLLKQLALYLCIMKQLIYLKKGSAELICDRTALYQPGKNEVFQFAVLK